MNDQHLERILFGPTADPQVGKTLDLPALVKQQSEIHMAIYRSAYDSGFLAGLRKAMELLDKHKPRENYVHQ